MTIYTALVDFIDKQDNNRLYHAGDIYPRDGYAVTEERAAELSSRANKLGKPVIVETKEPHVIKQEEAKPVEAEIPVKTTAEPEEKPVEKKTRGRKKTT